MRLLAFIILIVMFNSSCVTQAVFEKAINIEYDEGFKEIFWIKPLCDSIIVIKGIGNIGRSGVFDTVCLAINLPADFKHISTGKVEDNSLKEKYYKDSYKDTNKDLYCQYLLQCNSYSLKEINLSKKRSIPYIYNSKPNNFTGKLDEDIIKDTLIQKHYYDELILVDTSHGSFIFEHLIGGNNNEVFRTIISKDRTFKYRKRKYFGLLPVSVVCDIILIPAYVPMGILVLTGVIKK